MCHKFNKFLQVPQVLEEFPIGTVSKCNQLQERATGFAYYKKILQLVDFITHFLCPITVVARCSKILSSKNHCLHHNFCLNFAAVWNRQMLSEIHFDSKLKFKFLLLPSTCKATVWVLKVVWIFWVWLYTTIQDFSWLWFTNNFVTFNFKDRWFLACVFCVFSIFEPTTSNQSVWTLALWTG